MREFLRRCPACGRPFTVRIEGRKLVGSEHESEEFIQDIAIPTMALRAGKLVIPVDATITQLPIERDYFEISYRCNHCKHEWTEKVTKVEKG